MTKFQFYNLLYITVILLVGILIHIQNNIVRDIIDSKEIFTTDTIYLRDTVVIKEPEYITKTVIRYERLSDALESHQISPVDTLSTPVDTIDSRCLKMPQNAIVEDSVPLVQKLYKEKNYEAYVSGYIDCNLDSLILYPESRVITNVVKKKQRFTHGIQAGVGYGIITRKPDIYVGYGVSFNF